MKKMKMVTKQELEKKFKKLPTCPNKKSGSKARSNFNSQTFSSKHIHSGNFEENYIEVVIQNIDEFDI